MVGMILHYRPLGDDDKLATPKPALVMGLDEHDPPNLDLHVFRPPSEGAGQEVMTRVPPAETTVTGSGWAWPEWMVAARVSADGDVQELRRMASAGEPLVDTSKAAEGRDAQAREGQEGSVILLVLGSVLLAGALSTALGL